MKFSRMQLATLFMEVMIVVRLILTFALTKPSVPDRQEAPQSIEEESQEGETNQMPAP